MRNLEGGAFKRERKKLSTQIRLLSTCGYYLETNPRPAFVRQQLDDITVRLGVIRSRFGAWCAYKTGGVNELKKEFNKAYEVSKLTAQIKILKYLLDDE